VITISAAQYIAQPYAYEPRPWGDVPSLADLVTYFGCVVTAERIRAAMVARFQEGSK
jgi:hypothetical protein